MSNSSNAATREKSQPPLAGGLLFLPSTTMSSTRLTNDSSHLYSTPASLLTTRPSSVASLLNICRPSSLATGSSSITLSPFSPIISSLSSASCTFDLYGRLSTKCVNCRSLFDSVHHLPKLFPTCFHTVCAQCICNSLTETPKGTVTLICPIGNSSCQPTEFDLHVYEDPIKTLIDKVDSLPTNIAALCNSVSQRILDGGGVCDGPFCCLNEHKELPCQKMATILYKPQSTLLCGDCVMLNRLPFAAHSLQSLCDLTRDRTQLLIYLREHRDQYARCVAHPYNQLQLYCRTCHTGVCKDCLPHHLLTEIEDEFLTYKRQIFHNIRHFDDQALKIETGFLNAYRRWLREDQIVLGLIIQLLSRVLRGVQVSSVAVLGSLLFEVSSSKADNERLCEVIGASIDHCSAPELCALRPWIRNRGSNLHLQTKQFVDHLERLWQKPAEQESMPPTPPQIATPPGARLRTPPGNHWDDEQVAPATYNNTEKAPHRVANFFVGDEDLVDNRNWGIHLSTDDCKHPRLLAKLSATGSLEPIVENRSLEEESDFQLVPELSDDDEDAEVVYSDEDDDRSSLSIKSQFAPSFSAERRSNSALDLPLPMSTLSDQVNDMVSAPSVSACDMQAVLVRHRIFFTFKIGEAGEESGQFSEPSGLAVTKENRLVVADSNHHRMQIFQIDGRFVTMFGRGSDPNSSLHFPNRVAIGPNNEFFITERAPLMLVQVFDANCRFVRRFAEGEIQHPRAICVDHENNILVLQGLVMTVSIYAYDGNKLKHFSCVSDHHADHSVSFPTAMCANKKKEIFIADNTKHSIFVFTYEGELVRVICPGVEVIHYPIGLALNHRDELVVCDNHETFNITLMTQEGKVIRGFQSQVKHSGVYDVCLVNNGRAVAMSCRDYKVYIYEYEMPDGGLPPARRFPPAPFRNRNKMRRASMNN